MEGKNEKRKQIEESGKQLEEEIMEILIGLFAELNLRDTMKGKSSDSMEKFKQLDEKIQKKERGTVLSLSPMRIVEGDEKSKKANGFSINGSNVTISIREIETSTSGGFWTTMRSIC